MRHICIAQLINLLMMGTVSCPEYLVHRNPDKDLKREILRHYYFEPAQCLPEFMRHVQQGLTQVAEIVDAEDTSYRQPPSRLSVVGSPVIMVAPAWHKTVGRLASTNNGDCQGPSLHRSVYQWRLCLITVLGPSGSSFSF